VLCGGGGGEDGGDAIASEADDIAGEGGEIAEQGVKAVHRRDFNSTREFADKQDALQTRADWRRAVVAELMPSPPERACSAGRSAQGRLVFHMFGALAEFERSLIGERTQAGLAAARRAGRTGGRPPKLTDDDIEVANALLANPDIGVTQIAHRMDPASARAS
jgi:hypothetical protein